MSRLTAAQIAALPERNRREIEAQTSGPVARRNYPGIPDSSPPPVATKRPRGVRTEVDGIAFPSKTQAVVYQRLRDECVRANLRLIHEPRMPCWTLADWQGRFGRGGYVRPDFVILDGTRIVRIVDAKPKNRKAISRDWERGRRALESSYGVKVEEVDR